MKSAVNLESYWRHLASREISVADVIRTVANLGVDGIEIMDGFVYEVDLPNIRAALAETGLAVPSYDVHGDLIDPDPVHREGQHARIRTALHRAKALGAPTLLVIPGLIKEGISVGQAQQWYVEGLRAIQPAATRLGLTLMIENVGMAEIARFCGTSDHIMTICATAGPAVRTLYDVGNYLMAGDESLPALDRVAPRIGYVHFKDWRILPSSDEAQPYVYRAIDGRGFQGAVLGDGVVNLKGALARLREIGYQGYVAAEYEGPDDPRSAIPRAVRYLQDLLAS